MCSFGTVHVYVKRNFGEHGFALNGGWTGRAVKWLRAEGFGTRPTGQKPREGGQATGQAAAAAARLGAPPSIVGGATLGDAVKRSAAQIADESPTTASTVSKM